MSSFDPTNTFKLFPQKVEDGSKKPNVTGEVNVNGKTFRLAGWKKVSQKGTNWIGGAVTELEEKSEKKAEPASEEIPF
tara:strand:+ start:1150 stop:1383 length:234 start_codon:yes stop_codon:yes gene_type:complete